LPVAKVDAYRAYARDAGYPPPLETVVYPGAYHAWTVPTLGAERFYPQYGSTRKCPFVLLAAMGPMLLINRQERPFDLDFLRACIADGRGYSMAYDASARSHSADDAVAFLRKYLRP